jgi:membrane-associated phospholipid phosphatase
VAAACYHAAVAGRRRPAAALVALALVATPATALAEPTKPGAAFGSDWAEGALAVGTAGTLAFRFLPQRKGDWGPSHAASFAFDTGLVSDFVGAGIGSVMQLAAGYGFETAYLASHGVDQPAVDALRSVAVEGEALMLAGGLTYAIKRAAGRCRPRAWQQGACRGGEYDAFPSGHTSSVGAFGGARLVTVLRSDPDDDNAGIRWTSFAIAETTIVATGILRVAAHAHSWEDVVGGGIIGHAAGIAIALAHPAEPLDLGTPIGTRRRSTGSSARARNVTYEPPMSAMPPVAFAWGASF